MKRHPIDVVSLVLGVITVIVALEAVNNRLGNLINDRPDALLPTLVLLVGALLLAVTTRRALRAESATENVDGAGDDQGDRAE
jgi:hypothetical protein